MLALIGGSILSGHEFWPICNYPMFDALNPHPPGDSLEFYTQAPGEPEQWLHEDAALGRLHHEFALAAILDQDGWPSVKATESFRRVLEYMRLERETIDPAWAGPITLRAYRVHYTWPATGPLRRQVTGKDLLLEVTDPKP